MFGESLQQSNARRRPEPDTSLDSIRAFLAEKARRDLQRPPSFHPMPLPNPLVPRVPETLVAGASQQPWVQEGYPNTSWGYNDWLEERTNRRNEQLPEPPEGPPPFKNKNWKPGDPLWQDPHGRQKMLDLEEKLRQKRQGPERDILVPALPKKRSFLEDSWGPFARTTEAINGQTPEFLAMVQEYIRDHPDELNQLLLDTTKGLATGTGPVGPSLGMHFRPNPTRGPELSLANQISRFYSGEPLVRFTRNPKTWWVKGSSEIDPKYKALEEAGRAGSDTEVYSLHPELLTRTGGPAESRMSLTVNHKTKEGVLEFVGVTPSARESGFGGELARSAIIKAKDLGMKSLRLQSLPGNVMGAAGKPHDLRLVDWYKSMGFVEQGAPVEGMPSMAIPDLSKWPPPSKGVMAYNALNDQYRRWIEAGMPSTPEPNPRPPKRGFVPEEVPREEGMEEVPLAPYSPSFINARTLHDRIDAPPDVREQYSRRGRLPESYMSRLYPGASFRAAAEHYQLYPEDMNTSPEGFNTTVPDVPARSDRGRPDPGESWSDYLARIRGLQR